jgi:hypothetical protein
MLMKHRQAIRVGEGNRLDQNGIDHSEAAVFAPISSGSFASAVSVSPGLFR